MPKPPIEQNTRNSLIAKIALFLNYLGKENYEKLNSDMEKFEDPSRVDILKIMLAKNLVSPQDMASLKKTCLNFAKAHTDIRFGALCIQFEFLTHSNLALALEEQENLTQTGKTVRLGNLLVDAGMISERQKNLVLQKQKIENNSKKDNGCSREAFKKENLREIRENKIILLIPDRALKAYIQKTDDFDNTMSLDDLKSLLEKNGIIYGLASEERLQEFIENERYKTTPFEAACGVPPVDDTDARIVPMFKPDYLTAGSLSKDGTMDFKSRGDIPFVKEGDVLAEKIPLKEGRDGVNVYGDTLLKTEAEDPDLIPGRGAALSENKLQIIATAEGNPKAKPDGEISVNNVYFIKGDVDYTTGHVKFDKNVIITGTIKSGFRVEAIDVIAKTIDGGAIEASGDVYIENGVTESSIEAKGSIKAGFMHRSEAGCLGDLHITKEITDTRAVTEGTFLMPAGRMFSSTVYAKGGAKVYNIGSDRSKPSTIMVGTSMYLDKQLAEIDAEIEKNQTILEDKSKEKETLGIQVAQLTEKLKSYENSKQRTISMLGKMGETPDADKESMALFKKGLDETSRKIELLRKEKSDQENHLGNLKKVVEKKSERIAAAIKEKFYLKRINQKTPPKPIVEIAGKAFGKTRINGKFARLILSRPISRSRIMEMRTDDGTSSGKNWEMVITHL